MFKTLGGMLIYILWELYTGTTQLQWQMELCKLKKFLLSDRECLLEKR